MTQEELIQFLKDNLKIEIIADNKYCDSGYEITVKILLGNDFISESSDYITCIYK